MTIPLARKGNLKVENLITEREIEEITNILTINFDKTIRKYKKAGKLEGILFNE